MKLINAQIKWIMIVSGLFTCSMFLALIAPAAGLEMLFGGSLIQTDAIGSSILDEAFVQIVIRNWGALIGMVGLLLIHGGFKAHSRYLILIIAAVSKSVFIALNLIIGSEYLSTSIIAIVLDSVFILLYVLYLLDNRPSSL
jgi:hypothetical protein